MQLSGVYLSFSDKLDLEANRNLHAHARSLLESPLPGVTDIIPGYTKLYVEFDANRVSEQSVLEWAQRRQTAAPGSANSPVEIPTYFDGVDLPQVARATNLSQAEVIRRFTEATYHVYATGFTPGFPFLGEVEKSLRLARRGAPHKRVPANSVAMANTQAGIYPLPTPGGWHLLGTSCKQIYDPTREKVLLLEPGDSVKFVAANKKPQPKEVPGLDLLPEQPGQPILKILQPGLMDLVVDAGRFMAGRFGFARGGPVDASLAQLANRLLGNKADAPLLELTLTGSTFEVMRAGVLAVTGWALHPVLNGVVLEPFTSFAVKRGDTLSFKPQARGSRSYLAAAGGLAANTFMGSASVDVRSKLGRALQTGDVLGLAEQREARAGRHFTPYFAPYRYEADVTLRLKKGPQFNEDAVAALCENTFSVGRADRMGIQLEGASVPGGEVMSEATPLGALQITPSGLPLLLLHDRGTLGGYGKPAILQPADLSKAAQLRLGQAVRFVYEG